VVLGFLVQRKLPLKHEFWMPEGKGPFPLVFGGFQWKSSMQDFSRSPGYDYLR